MLMLGAAASLLYAQPRHDPDKFQDRVEVLTIWKMMEALDLDRATADKMIQIRKKYLERKKELTRSVKDDFRKLRKLLRDPSDTPSEEDLAAMVSSIKEKRKQIQALWDEQYNEVSKILSVRQQAELVLFLREFRSELEAIMRPPPPPPPHHHPGDGSHGGMGPPPPPPPRMEGDRQQGPPSARMGEGHRPGPPPAALDLPDEADDPIGER